MLAARFATWTQLVRALPTRARGLAAAALPAPPPAAQSAPSGSLAYGLRHLRGETKAPAPRSPMGYLLGTFVWFGFAAGLGWAVAQPMETAGQIGEAATAAFEAAKASLPEASSGSSEDSHSMSNLFDNIMLLSDSYKTSHWRQYPQGTTTVYSYFESRGGKFPETTFFGLQYIIKRYLTGVVVTQAKIDTAAKIVNGHMGQGEMEHFNRAGWEHILKKHGGRLPIVIKALPEGMTVPTKN
ncbi:hypothetical protein T492DRAFT_917720, partial [Pavlovales sp. CCMP2436]